jgi:hypothetical protein
MHPMFIDVKQRTQQLLKDNSATILTAGGVVGTVATAVLTGKAAFKAAEVILAEEGARLEENARRANKSIDVQVEPLTTIEKAKMVWPHFVPPVLTGSATIGSIIMANRMSAQKAAALAAAYGWPRSNSESTRTRSRRSSPAQKAQTIEDELAQDRVNNTPGAQSDRCRGGRGALLR